MSRLTSRQPTINEDLEWEQRNDRDRQKEKERGRQIQAGMAKQPIFLPIYRNRCR